MRACGTIPFVSPWLHRFRVLQVSRRAAAGDNSAVCELAAVFCTSADPGARSYASEGLGHLRTPEQAGIICREALLRDNAGLIQLACRYQYLPPSAGERAVWFFCTSQQDELRRIDPEEHFPTLAAGYAASDEPVRLQARNAARRDAACDILARALSGTSVTANASRWSFDEWDVVIAGLNAGARWNDLWLLATLAPLPLARDAVQALREADWSPRGDDRIVWEDLARHLPEHCPAPPAGVQRIPVGKPAGQVVRLCFSPDGSLFATGTCDGMITVRRTTTAGVTGEFSAGNGAVMFIGIPPDNASLISACDDGIVRCHGIGGNGLLWEKESREGFTVLSLAHDGKTLLAGGDRGALHILGIRDGREIATSLLHPSPVTSIAPSPAGPSVACGHADGTISIVMPGSNSPPSYLQGNGSAVRGLSCSSRGEECLAVYDSGFPAFWNIADKTRRCTYGDHRGRTVCAAVPSACGWFAAASDDNTLRCWDVSTAKLMVTLPFYSRNITSCSVSADGSLLAAGLHDGSVRVWKMPEGRLVREFRGHKKTVTTCMFDPGGTRLATVSWDGTTKLWRIPGMEIVRTIDSHAGSIAALAGPADTLVAAVTEDGVARIIDASHGTVTGTIDLYTASIRAAAMSPDGSYLASTGADSSLRIWDIRNGSLAAAADQHTTSWRCCAFLPCGTKLVTGGWDGTCRLFRVPDAVPLRTFSGHTSIVTCCTASREGNLLVTGSNDTTVRLWRTDEDEAYAVLRDSRSEVGAVALSPDGTFLAAGGSDGMLRLYRLPYGTPEQGVPGIPGTVTALVFSGDGCILAAGYDTGTCALFSLPGRSLLRTVPAHSGPVTALCVLPDGVTLVSTGEDGLCRFHALPCMPFLVHARPSDIPAGGPDCRPAPPSGPDPAAFHRALLTARFREEIGICPPIDTAGLYDIQIVG